MFGRSVGCPAARRRASQRRLSASPQSIAASLDPVVEQPTAASSEAPATAPGAFHSRDSIATQRDSISAVCGYSSLSIMFLLKQEAISSSASGSIHVVTKVARLSRALPSSISSSSTIRRAVRGSMLRAGSAVRGIAIGSLAWSGLTASVSERSAGGDERWRAMAAR